MTPHLHTNVCTLVLYTKMSEVYCKYIPFDCFVTNSDVLQGDVLIVVFYLLPSLPTLDTVVHRTQDYS